MSSISIIKYPNPVLRKKAKKIKDPQDTKIQKLISAMIEVLNEKRGLGLAAPQVNESLRLCIVREERDENKFYILINPQIKFASREKSVAEEGCLSLPGKYLFIERPDKVKIRYLDEMGKKCKMKAEGLLARAIQHEIDHLDGILMIDRICPSPKIKKSAIK